jgi:hypothetical protein
MGEASSATADPRPIQTIRETAKWILTAFAAIAAVLITGLQLSAIGQLSLLSWRFLAAMLGLLLGLSCASWAILRASDVVSIRFLALRELAEEQHRVVQQLRKHGLDELALKPSISPLLFALRENAAEVFFGNATEIAELFERQNLMHQALYKLRRHEPVRWDNRTYQPDDLDKLESAALALHNAAQQAVDWANEWTTRRQYNTLRRRVVPLAGIGVVAGLAVFAWAVNPPTTTPAAHTQTALPVSVLFTKDAAQKIPGLDTQHALCIQDQNGLPAIALASDLREPEIVTIPHKDCPPLRITITKDLGTVIPQPQ